MDRYVFAKGRPANDLAVTGVLALDSATAVRWAGEGQRVILCRPMTDPSDIAGMDASVGILTARGGALSHAAVVAREMGKGAVVGAGFEFDEASRTITANTVTLREGAEVILEADGTVIYYA